MEEPYKRLDDVQRLNSEQDSILGPARGMTTMNNIQSDKPRLKMYKGLVTLAIVEIGLAILIFLLGASCTAVGRMSRENIYRAPSCLFGTGIWVGILCIVAATNGLLSLRVPYGRRGFMIAYMVLCIIAAISDGILIFFSGLWLAHNSNYYVYYGHSTALVSTCLNSFLVVVAIVHMILSIISSAFLCCNFNCCGRKQDIIIVYAANHGNNPNAETIKFLPPDLIAAGKNARIIYA